MTTVDGGVTSIRLRLAVPFPAPAARVTHAVRAHVADRVQRMCELDVDHVDGVVSALVRDREQKRRVL